MPPESSGNTFESAMHSHAVSEHPLVHTVHICHVIRLRDSEAASTNIEFDTSATCHIDHVSLTESLPCNSGGPVIPDPELHQHVGRRG
jgi:hypothetical protein